MSILALECTIPTEYTYPELVKRQAPNKLLFLKSKRRSHVISHGVLAGPNIYYVQTHNDNIKKVCKGVSRYYVKENFNKTVYWNCVENSLIPRANIMAILSLIFKSYTVIVEKKTITATSDKVYVFVDGMRILPNGHYLASDRNICIGYRQRLRLKKFQ